MHPNIREKRLLELARAGRLPHALLLCGPEGSGRMALARRAAALYCLGADDPDAILRSPLCTLVDGTAVELVRQLREELSKQAFSEGNRIVIIKDAHTLTPQAQNALLKTLEEPPQRTAFLLTGIAEGVLATIRSRCTIIRLGTTPVEDIEQELILAGVDPQSARVYAAASRGIPGGAHQLSKSPELQQTRKNAFLFIERMLEGKPAFDLAAPIVSAGEETAGFALECMRSLLGDIARLQAGVESLENPDEEPSVRKAAQRFTIGRVQGMIKQLNEAGERRAAGLGAAAVMDYLLSSWIGQA